MRVIIFLFLIIIIIINLLLYIIFVKLVKQEQKKKEYVLYGPLFDCIIINNQGGHVCDRDKAST
jgi:cell division protein FtsI/penicillin-binding protein 2